MKNNRLKKMGLLFIIIILFIFLTVIPMSIGYNINKLNMTTIAENYDCYHVSEIPNFIKHRISKASNIYDNIKSEKISKSEETLQPVYSPPMDSPWPMYCHDIQHTGRSPYSTVNNSGHEKWRFETKFAATGYPIIDNDEIIYIGTYEFYAIYPDGTLKWKNEDKYVIRSAATIDENGILYVGSSFGSYGLYAINPNGTTKWRFPCGDIYSSPAIGDDGTIYFGSEDHNIYALNPDKTLKWKFTTDYVVYSSPAIGDDGTVYCGSHDTYLYALYPNNGTLKWKYKTGHWIRTSPCIADDGTIYVVSLDNYLHAVYINGTMKWKTDVGAGTSPTIGQDGTIYCGFSKLYAINPINGSVKWKFNPGADRRIRGGTPCNSIDGTIYFGTHIDPYHGGEIIAVNPDGTEKWRIMVATDWIDSAPAIGKDGTIYVGSQNDNFVGFLHAIGKVPLEADANGPYYGQINESIQFQGSAKGGYRPHSYHWDFGDGNASDEEDPIHIYTNAGNYTVTFTLTDNTSNSSSDTTFAWIRFQEFNYPPDKPDIDGPTSVKVGQSYDYSFNATDPDENNIWYHICWGDKEIIYIYGPYSSGEELKLSYTWLDKGTYPITCWARDIYDEVSDTATLEVEVPRNRMITNLWYLWFLERFPILQKLLLLIN